MLLGYLSKMIRDERGREQREAVKHLRGKKEKRKKKVLEVLSVYLIRE